MTRIILAAAGVPLAIWGPMWSAVAILGMLVVVILARLLRGRE